LEVHYFSAGNSASDTLGHFD
jgi:hypothetical protein